MTKNMQSGLLAVILGLAYLAGTFKIPMYDTGDSIGPRSFPFLIAAIVLICGVALIINDLRAKERKPFSWGFVANSAVWLRIAATIFFGIAFGLVLDTLGYLIAMFLFMIIITELINVGRHKQNLIISVLFALISFLSFAVLLKLSLPRGLLGGILPF